MAVYRGSSGFVSTSIIDLAGVTRFEMVAVDEASRTRQPSLPEYWMHFNDGNDGIGGPAQVARDIRDAWLEERSRR